MITRTLSITEVELTYAYITDDMQFQTEERKIKLDGIKTLEEAQKELSKAANNGKVKVHKVTHINKVWGISLEDFIKYGKEVKRPESQLASCMKNQ